MFRVALILGWLSIVAATGIPARGAETPPTVLVLFSGERDVALAVRICWELETLGFEARSSDGTPPGETPQELSEFATAHGADALIQVHLSDAALDVWVADEMTGKVVFRSQDVVAGDEPTEAVLALSAVELLRASLLEIQGRDDAPEAVVALVGGAEDATARARIWPRVWLDGGVGMALVAAEVGPAMVWDVSAAVRVAPILRVDLTLSGSLAAARASYPEGTVRVRPFYAGLALLGGSLDASRRVRPTLGGGVGVASIRMTGDAAEGYTSRDQSHVCPFLFIRGGGAVRVGEFAAIRGDLTIGFTTTSAVMRVVGTDVARLGLPWLTGGVALEVTAF